MAEIKQIRAIKGVRDILPPASAAWNRVEQAAREVFATFGYGEIRLPIFEETELFARSVGAIRILCKEMFTFQDREVRGRMVVRTEKPTGRYFERSTNSREVHAGFNSFFVAAGGDG